MLGNGYLKAMFEAKLNKAFFSFFCQILGIFDVKCGGLILNLCHPSAEVGNDYMKGGKF